MTDTSNAAIGTAYVDPATGDLYRLRGFGFDWMHTRPENMHDAEPTCPDYAVLLTSGAMSTSHALPAGAVTVWTTPTLASCDGSCGDPEPHGLHHEPLGL